MSATIEAAMKAELETGGHGISFFNREAPQYVIVNGQQVETPLPYAICWGLDVIAQRTGDGDMKRARELIQVDVYQEADAIDPFLAKNIFKQLRKARLATAPEYVFRIEDLTLVPAPDPAVPDVMRHTISGTVRRRI